MLFWLTLSLFLALPPSLPPRDTSLELDFDALDDDLSESGEHKTSSLSGTPSPPLASRGLTDSGTSYSNLDTQSCLDLGGSRDNLSSRATSRGGSEVRGDPVGVNGVGGSKDSTPMSPTGAISISLGSLDIDLDFPSSFGLGTITEGRSLMNIPSTISETSGYDGSGVAPNNGLSSSQKAGTGGLQRSISQQPLQAGVADKGRNMSYQPQKRSPPQTAPKPRRGSYTVTHPAPSPPPAQKSSQTPPPAQKSSHNPPPAQKSSQNPPPAQKHSQKLPPKPTVSKIGRQTSETVERVSPQQARKEMMKSTPALFPSPPRSRRNTDSLPRHSSRVMTPLLPFQDAQELREAANKVKQESGTKSSNGVIPHMSPGSPILIRRGAGSKQSSPPLSSYRASSKHSPKHGQRNSPIASRLYPPHLSPGGMKGSSSMTRLAPSSSYSAPRTTNQDEAASTMSRNSSIDSGIQYSSEGETTGGGGATSGERASNTSTATTDSAATSTSLASAGSEGKEGRRNEDPTAPAAKKEGEGEKTGLGDFSDVLSVIANMGGGDSWF